MIHTFKYGKIDRRAKRMTIIWFVVLAFVIFSIWFFLGQGGYMTAWIVSLFAAGFALYLMSIPRKIIVTESALEIHCIVEITQIKYDELQNIHRISSRDMARKYVVAGSYGFFGYYGYFLDPEDWEFVKLYCTEWNNFVEITDIYEKKYIVSATDPDALVKTVTEAADKYRETTENK